jgi:hypothetical protein
MLAKIPNAYCADQNIKATITINPGFSLALAPGTPTIIDIGGIEAGTSKFGFPDRGGGWSGIVMNVVANNGSTWHVTVQDTLPLTHANGLDTIPNENFRWGVVYVDGDGTVGGTGNYGKIDNSMSTNPVTAYTSGTKDKGGGQVVVSFGLIVPSNTIEGIYKTDVVLTLVQ